MPAYPPSPVIEQVLWGPTNSTIRGAQDGDNWPVTWASDDALYTTWGDGTGFVPKVEQKLSCGLPQITGSPPDFHGGNIRSSGEQSGQGRDGLKSWGILGDLLYVWFGHADKAGGAATLAWSDDRARKWIFATWQFTGFGLLGFVNDGHGYEVARGVRSNAASGLRFLTDAHCGPLAPSWGAGLGEGCVRFMGRENGPRSIRPSNRGA